MALISNSVQETRQAASLPAPARARSAACVLCCSRVYDALLPRAPGARRYSLPLRANDADPVHSRTHAPCALLLPHAFLAWEHPSYARGHPSMHGGTRVYAALLPRAFPGHEGALGPFVLDRVSR